MKIVLVNGSPNRAGNTAALLDAAAAEIVKAGAAVSRIDVAEALASARWPFCTACSNPCSGACFTGTALEEAYDAIAGADGVLIGSPVYFGTVSAQLKAFFDKTRQVRGKKAWFGLPGGAVTCGASRFGGQETTVRAIHDMMLVQGMTLVGDGYLENDCGHFGASAQKPAAADADGLKRAGILGRRIVEAARALARKG
ncbi:flavodoxin family protein [Heliobacterium gestii]|uniref:Flavodoxin family protein n=1 Tax=Heliomicrobium gestii TaxID=2699 RepID=A0A845LFZ7_HELGE|nr:flavodoxin family protein [Heliomicrobium gestii]MBM7865525.1 multimeric flavodoxin WrbA [Heliomicrobium gestii]MZP41776.1 flavodoxin family protein [Heliomicrobium gestii]